jgi:hypothetical protein
MNTTLANEPPLITIDPIENHTIGDIIFITGTTNLPVTNNLMMNIYSSSIACPVAGNGENPNPENCEKNIAQTPGISIIPDLPGSNMWSINATDTVKDFDINESPYLIQIQSEENISIAADQQFNLLPPQAPFITIDPIGNQTIGDVFCINGTTNLPVTDNLLMTIASEQTWICWIAPVGASKCEDNNIAQITDVSITPDQSGPNR